MSKEDAVLESVRVNIDGALAGHVRCVKGEVHEFWETDEALTKKLKWKITAYGSDAKVRVMDDIRNLLRGQDPKTWKIIPKTG